MTGRGVPVAYRPTREQAATVATLDVLSAPDVTVDAMAIDVWTEDPCEACPDEAPEVAMVLFTLHGVRFAYCPEHAVAFLRRELPVRGHVSAYVLRAELVRWNPLYSPVVPLSTGWSLLTELDAPGECGPFCVICSRRGRYGIDEFRWRSGKPVVGDSLTSRVGA